MRNDEDNNHILEQEEAFLYLQDDIDVVNTIGIKVY
jgi:hypothetical protein